MDVKEYIAWKWKHIDRISELGGDKPIKVLGAKFAWVTILKGYM